MKKIALVLLGLMVSTPAWADMDPVVEQFLRHPDAGSLRALQLQMGIFPSLSNRSVIPPTHLGGMTNCQAWESAVQQESTPPDQEKFWRDLCQADCNSLNGPPHRRAYSTLGLSDEAVCPTANIKWEVPKTTLVP